jgi:GTP-binding protein
MLLFIIPSDSKNIKEEYEILVNELKMYNPELLDKKRLLGISKSDLTDEELKNEIRKELPDISRVFFSSVTGEGISTLKDMIWKELNNY